MEKIFPIAMSNPHSSQDSRPNTRKFWTLRGTLCSFV